jgi:hypothetical protein
MKVRVHGGTQNCADDGTTSSGAQFVIAYAASFALCFRLRDLNAGAFGKEVAPTVRCHGAELCEVHFEAL